MYLNIEADSCKSWVEEGWNRFHLLVPQGEGCGMIK
jgi:hypothetical protein